MADKDIAANQTQTTGHKSKNTIESDIIIIIIIIIIYSI